MAVNGRKQDLVSKSGWVRVVVWPRLSPYTTTRLLYHQLVQLAGKVREPSGLGSWLEATRALRVCSSSGLKESSAPTGSDV